MQPDAPKYQNFFNISPLPRPDQSESRPVSVFFLRLFHHAGGAAAVDANDDGRRKLHHPHMLALVDSGLTVKVFLIEVVVFTEGIDGEISHAERGEILEEMRALARLYPDLSSVVASH